MEQLPQLVSGVLVSLLTSGTRQLVSVVGMSMGKPVLRLCVAVLSYLAALGSGAISGNEVDPVSIQVLVDTGVNFLVASGVHLFAKKVNG